MRILHKIAATWITYGAVLLGIFFLVPFTLSKKLREAYFARFVFPLTVYVNRDQMNPVRQKVTSYLDDLVSHDAVLRNQNAIRVLEIGAGFGANFQFIKRKVKYWNVDPNAEFDDALRKNLQKNPNVEMEQWIHEYAEDMRGVPDDHFDVVLFTHLLCSVTEMEKVLAECKRVLTKGGRLVFTEHVAHPEGSWGFLVQWLMDPLWSFIYCGCHVTKRTGDVLKNAGFDLIQLNEVVLSIPTVLSRRVYGFAIVNKD